MPTLEGRQARAIILRRCPGTDVIEKKFGMDVTLADPGSS
jgi:hypothetical protein